MRKRSLVSVVGVLVAAGIMLASGESFGLRRDGDLKSDTSNVAQQGLIKPTMNDTIKANIYADNWFMMYINGKLVVTDPIDFLPHNVVSIDLLPEYPMTIAVLAKDNADPKTGLEYGDHIGDAGFTLMFSDGTTTDATWKVKSLFKGPINRDISNPKVYLESLPKN
jgi:hypothetical protein